MIQLVDDGRTYRLEVTGQPVGWTAVEVSAAGGHHALLLGPPGSGKTMLAERMSGIPSAPSSATAVATTVLGMVTDDDRDYMYAEYEIEHPGGHGRGRVHRLSSSRLPSRLR